MVLDILIDFSVFALEHHSSNLSGGKRATCTKWRQQRQENETTQQKTCLVLDLIPLKGLRNSTYKFVYLVLCSLLGRMKRNISLEFC